MTERLLNQGDVVQMGGLHGPIWFVEYVIDEDRAQGRVVRPRTLGSSVHAFATTYEVGRDTAVSDIVAQAHDFEHAVAIVALLVS
jgi:hypothetical protein